MARKINIKCPGVPEGERLRAGYVRKPYIIEVITPIFGGGVDKGQVDANHPIRGTAIRGHLRFWWRATNGAAFSSVAELRKREAEIWGDTSSPSAVNVKVKIEKCEQRSSQDITGRIPVLKYVLFPFQGNQRQGVEPANCLINVRFSLTLIYPDPISDDVDAAMRAWVNFGGIGGRTRRGCGVLYCPDFAPASVRELGTLTKMGAGTSSKEWATVRKLLVDRDTVEQKNGYTVQELWKCLVEQLKLFRQGTGFARTDSGDPRHPGRSFWPEPDTLRRACRGNYIHAPDPSMPDACPRAELGLPIIIDFGRSRRPEPEPAEIMPEYPKQERFASPVIMKPLKCADGHMVNVAIMLAGPLPQRVRLGKHGGSKPVNVRPDPGNYGPKSPMNNRTQSGSALEAFEKFLIHDCGYQEAC